MNAPLHALAVPMVAGSFNPQRFAAGALEARSPRDIPGLQLHAPAGGLAWNARYLVAASSHAAHWLKLLDSRGARALEAARGPYALAFVDVAARTLTLAVDRFSIKRLCYRMDGDTLHFAERADALGRDIEPQALFDYFHAHVIPVPTTVWRGVARLGAAARLSFSAHGLTLGTHWQPRFEPVHRITTRELAAQFRMLVKDAVRREIDNTHTGCFLSGGTDSSTVAGMLSTITGARVPTYSIGFAVPGYDEMDYAERAAAHFNCTHHAHYVSPADLLDTMPHIAALCDQPFGNSSLAPATICATLARDHGTLKLLAGDGGDELFGGNARYAEQKLFALWAHLPAPLQRAIAAAAARTPHPALARKAASYIAHASTPLPDRLERYNLLHRLGLAQVFNDDFLRQIDPEHALALHRKAFAQHADEALINALLAYDWHTTLADNDLPKVTQAVAAAGLAVGFPLLDEKLVDFSLTLAPALKVRGLSLRYFFKAALKNFLPRAILKKKKHGFGLPYGPWLLTDTALRAAATDAMQSLASRGVVRHEFVRSLLNERLPAHPGYYGEMVWLMTMQELWLRAHAPGWRLAG